MENMFDELAAQTQAQAEKVASTTFLELTVVSEEGPYVGKVFQLYPKARGKDLLVGRSRGKKFLKNGLSLSEDSEVSTTHGCFGIIDGKICFKDKNSTNGSWLNGGELEPYGWYPLEEGDELLLGATRMRVALQTTTKRA